MLRNSKFPVHLNGNGRKNRSRCDKTPSFAEPDASSPHAHSVLHLRQDTVNLDTLRPLPATDPAPTQNEVADPDLARVNEIWATLPEVIRAGILAMVKAVPEGNRR
jgi:hypothetical protein